MAAAELAAAFSAFDVNGDGVISLEEFVAILTRSGEAGNARPMRRNEAEALFRSFDCDGNGVLSTEEFIRPWAVHLARNSLLSALDAVDAANGRENLMWKAQARVAVQAEAFAKALVDAPGDLPAPGTYASADVLYAALRPLAPDCPPPVRLLRSSWIKKRARQLRAAASPEERQALAMPRRQDLERTDPDAFMDEEELRARSAPDRTGSFITKKLALGALSYCWLTAEHPDPRGEQLVSLAAAIEAAEAGDQAFPGEAAFFIDFASLPQKGPGGRRTPAEAAAFSAALGNMQIWYSHPLVTAFLARSLPSGHEKVPRYEERGWTTCEASWAALAKPMSHYCWAPIIDVPQQGAVQEYRRPAPTTPAALARLVAGKRFTSKKSDLPMVIELNTRTILSLMRDTEKLEFAQCGWGDGEMEQLLEAASAPPSVTACPSRTMRLTPSLSPGQVLPLCRNLRKLWLFENHIGDDGVAALAKAALGGALSTLEDLHSVRKSSPPAPPSQSRLWPHRISSSRGTGSATTACRSWRPPCVETAARLAACRA